MNLNLLRHQVRNLLARPQSPVPGPRPSAALYQAPAPGWWSDAPLQNTRGSDLGLNQVARPASSSGSVASPWQAPVPTWDSLAINRTPLPAPPPPPDWNSLQAPPSPAVLSSSTPKLQGATPEIAPDISGQQARASKIAQAASALDDPAAPPLNSGVPVADAVKMAIPDAWDSTPGPSLSLNPFERQLGSGPVITRQTPDYVVPQPTRGDGLDVEYPLSPDEAIKQAMSGGGMTSNISAATPVVAVEPAPGNTIKATLSSGEQVLITDGAKQAAEGGDIAVPVAADMALAAGTLPAKAQVDMNDVRQQLQQRRLARRQARAAAAPPAPPKGPRNPDDPGDDAQTTIFKLSDALDSALAAPDFGIGALSGKGMREAAKNLRNQGFDSQARRLERLALLAEVALPVTATAASIGIPIALAAGSGNETAGGGGALLQGGGAFAGSLLGSGLGTPGRLVGGLIGGGVSGALVGGGRSAVDAANAGDTGLAGSIGNALDPLLDSEREVAERQLRSQLNSPVFKQMEEKKKQEQHSQMMQAMQMALMQSYLPN